MAGLEHRNQYNKTLSRPVYPLEEACSFKLTLLKGLAMEIEFPSTGVNNDNSLQSILNKVWMGDRNAYVAEWNVDEPVLESNCWFQLR